MKAPADRRDRVWLAIIAAAFVAGVAVSWQRWGSPLIDTGREMNQPLRLLDGERLYSDVRHIYGPLSPYLHAALFSLVGPSLHVLYVDGIVSASTVLALVYWLGRRIMTPLAAGTATLSVMWLCVFKPAGNYILPYSFSALHGTVFGLIALALVTSAVNGSERRPRIPGRFVLAGLATGLSVLAKTELGIAALAGGLAAALISTAEDRRKRLWRVIAFLVPALAVVGVTYGVLLAVVGWSPVVSDGWLLWYNVPPPLRRYNEWVSGFDHPVRSVTRMLIALAKLGALAAVIAAASHLMANGRDAAQGPDRARPLTARLVTGSPVRALVAALAILLVLAVTTGFDWDKGPYLAMPFLLVGLIWGERGRLAGATESATRARVLVVYAVYALACLGRMILHVRSGGAYGSFLLPMSVVLFTYLWAVPFGDWLETAGARRAGATLAIALILIDVVATAGLLAHRYRRRYQTRVATDRGTMIVEDDVGLAWNDAIALIEDRTAPGAFVAVLPEGTSLDFLTGRRNPLREEIATPGYLDGPDETRAIRQLDASAAPLVLITNRPTGEFGLAAFGHDYARGLMQFVESRYDVCAILGPVKDPALRIGDRPFFIRAYCLKAGPAHR